MPQPHPTIQGSKDAKEGKVKLRASGKLKETGHEEEQSLAAAASAAELQKKKMDMLKEKLKNVKTSTNLRRENVIPSGTMMVDEYDRAERFALINVDDVDQRKALEQKEAIRQKEEREAQDHQRLERRKLRFQMESAEGESVTKKIKDDKKPTLQLKPKEITVTHGPESKRTLSPASVGDADEEPVKKQRLAKEVVETMERNKYFDELKAKLMEGRNKTRNSLSGDTSQSTVTKAPTLSERNKSPPSEAVTIQPPPSSEKKAPTNATGASPATLKDVFKAPPSSPISKKVVVKSLRGASKATTSSSKKVESAKEPAATVSNMQPAASEAQTAPTPAAPAPPVVPASETVEPAPATPVAPASPAAPSSPAASVASQRVKSVSPPSRTDKLAPPSAPVKPSPAPAPAKAAPPTMLRASGRAVTAATTREQPQSETVASLISIAVPTSTLAEAKTSPSAKMETTDSAMVKESTPDASNTSAPDSLMTDAPNASKADAPDALKTSAPDSLMTDAPDALKADPLAVSNASTPAAEQEHLRVDNDDNDNPVDYFAQPGITPIAEEKIVESTSALTQSNASNSEPSDDKVTETKNTTLPIAPMCADSEDKVLPSKVEASTVLPSGDRPPDSEILPNKPDTPSDAAEDDGDRQDYEDGKPLESNSAPDIPVAASTAVNGSEKTLPDAKAPPPRLAKPSTSQVSRQALRSAIAPFTQIAGRTSSLEQRKFQYTPIVYNQKTLQPSSRPVPAGKPDAAKQPVARKTSSETTKKASTPSSGGAPQSPKAASSGTAAAASDPAKAAVSPREAASIPTSARSSSTKPTVAKGSAEASCGLESAASEPNTTQKTKVSQKTTTPQAKVDGANTTSVLKSLGKPAHADSAKTGGAKADPTRHAVRSKTPGKVGTKVDGAKSPMASKVAQISGIKRKERPSDEVESARKRLETESLWAKYTAELTELEESLLKMRPDLISTIEEELLTVSRDFADPAAFDRELDRLESLL